MRHSANSWSSWTRRIALLLLVWVSAGSPIRTTAAPTPGALSRQEATTYLAVQAKMSGNATISIADLDRRFGYTGKTVYTTSEIEAYLKSKAQQPQLASQGDQLKESGYQGSKSFPWVRLRRSYQDVLTAEDPSLSAGGVDGFDDLESALFSFSRDLRKDTESWTAKAALLAPFSFYTGYAPLKGEPLRPVRWGFVPSISLDRLTTSGDPDDQTEQFTHRIGAFTKMQSGHNCLLALTGRVFATYLEDHFKDQSVWAGEFELEPVSVFAPWAKIGTRTILVPKENPDDEHDTAWIAYQFRAILHGEWGSLNREGPAFEGTEYDFFRIGTVLQLDLKPLIAKNLSISLKYHRLPAIHGENTNDSLFTVDAEWAIYTSEAKLQKLSLKASYVNGGLELTKEKARTFMIGLGAAF
ncbi:MAG TPA: hypothetical protein VM940_01365 [Chthoniobacterales bacterium]|jgi:hypothetical protein|nr:hypothetical protein [Chthoniobacterales bacterium]